MVFVYNLQVVKNCLQIEETPDGKFFDQRYFTWRLVEKVGKIEPTEVMLNFY